MSHTQLNSARGPGPEDDLVLMDLIGRRDSSALGRLFDRYSTVVYALCLRILKDAGAAEEVMLDVFEELWARAERYQAARGAPAAYLMILTRSRALDRARAAGARKAHSRPLSEAAEAGDAASDPLWAVLLDERRSLICNALDQIEPKYREALECAYFEGLSHSQAAVRLGRPLGTIKTYLRRGLIQLRDLLRNWDEGAGDEGLAPVKGLKAQGADAASAPGAQG